MSWDLTFVKELENAGNFKYSIAEDEEPTSISFDAFFFFTMYGSLSALTFLFVASGIYFSGLCLVFGVVEVDASFMNGMKLQKSIPVV